MLIALTITVVVQALLIVALVKRLRFRARQVNVCKPTALTLAEQAQQIYVALTELSR
jgi:hypothetical protein